MLKRYLPMIVAAASALIATSAPAWAEPISLQCNVNSPLNGNFSGESVYVILDLDSHSVVSGYGDSAAHQREKRSALTEESDRLTWTYTDAGSNYTTIVDYILNRSTLTLLATLGGTNFTGATNTGNISYACSKVQKQI